MEGSAGRGDGGGTRGPLFGQQRGLWWDSALPQPEVLPPWQNQKALLSGGGVIGTCFWKAAWQQVRRALKMSLPSTSRNLF